MHRKKRRAAAETAVKNAIADSTFHHNGFFPRKQPKRRNWTGKIRIDGDFRNMRVIACRGRRPRRPVDSLQISGHHRRPHLPCRGEACLARPRSGSSTANSVRCTVPIAMPQILPASMALTERRYRRNWLVRFIGSLYGLQLPSRDCHVGLRPPRNDKPLAFAILMTAC